MGLRTPVPLTLLGPFKDVSTQLGWTLSSQGPHLCWDREERLVQCLCKASSPPTALPLWRSAEHLCLQPPPALAPSAPLPHTVFL